MVSILLTGGAAGANKYVRPTSSGSNTGTDWNNAWSLSSIKWESVHAGDTIWLAGGHYFDPLIIRSSGTVGHPINIWRARSTDPIATTASGWSASFDSQVIVEARFWPLLSIPNGNDLTIDGRTDSGILIRIPDTGGSASMAAQEGNVVNVFISHLEVIGPSATKGLSAGRYGFNWAPSSDKTVISGITFDHCIIHQLCEAFRASDWNGVTIQYCAIYDTTLDDIDHNDIIYSYPTRNVVFRYNTFYNSPSDGIFFEFGGATNFYYYGNVFFNSVYAMIQTKSPGDYGPLYIYNNVFMGQDANRKFAWISFQGRTSPETEVYNNIFFNCQNQSDAGGSVRSDYNAYYPAKVNGSLWPSNETHSFVLPADPFVDSANGNFHLTKTGAAVLAKGVALVADSFINKDSDGNTRAPRGWHIGAYQYAQPGN
jgi:hypothetical protein